MGPAVTDCRGSGGTGRSAPDPGPPAAGPPDTAGAPGAVPSGAVRAQPVPPGTAPSGTVPAPPVPPGTTPSRARHAQPVASAGRGVGAVTERAMPRATASSILAASS